MDEQQKQLNLQKPTIFLSYAREDETKVRGIYRKLLYEQLNPWLDLINLLPGQDWDKAIVNAIRNARFVVVFLSNHSVSKRGYVQKEIGEALDVAEKMPEGEIFIIPVRLGDCIVPNRLSKWQWIDVYRPGGFKRLVKTIKADLGLDDSIEPKSRERHTESVSVDEIADSLLIDKFPFGMGFMHTRLSTGQVVISNGHFMDFREKLPANSRELERKFPSDQELTQRWVSAALPPKRVYRKKANLLKEIKPVYDDKSAYVLVTKGNNRCGIYKAYMHYIQVKYPNYKVYIINETTPIVVEQNEKVCFVVMPFRVTPKVLSAA